MIYRPKSNGQQIWTALNLQDLEALAPPAEHRFTSLVMKISH